MTILLVSSDVLLLFLVYRFSYRQGYKKGYEEDYLKRLNTARNKIHESC